MSYTYSTSNCEGTAETHALTLTCSASSTNYYGFPAHYYWKLSPSSSSDSNGLSSGAIAGVVIGSIVGVGLLVGLVYYCVFMNAVAKAPLSKQDQFGNNL